MPLYRRAASAMKAAEKVNLRQRSRLRNQGRPKAAVLLDGVDRNADVQIIGDGVIKSRADAGQRGLLPPRMGENIVDRI
jgi:hypothetical protein